MDTKKIPATESPDDIETRMICETLDTGDDAVAEISLEQSKQLKDYFDFDQNETIEE